MTGPVRTTLRVAAYAAEWLLMSGVLALVLFLHSERTVDVISHEATVRPDLGGKVVLRTGPVFPDLRLDSGMPIGVEIELGKTDSGSLEELGQRYAQIAANPDGQVFVVERAVRDMAISAAARGLALGAIPVLVWVAVGRARRRELLRLVRTRRGLAGAGAVVLIAVGLTQPWEGEPDRGADEDWQPLSAFVGPEVPLPHELDGIQAQGGVSAQQTRRLVESAISTYEKGTEFYDAAAEAAKDLDLRKPQEGETVVVLVSDRHDNIGMDAVARAIGDRVGADDVYDAGDDTSTGESWEAFSLDSLDAAFDDYDGRWAVAGNHDNGTFVRDHLADRGWTYFDGEVLDGPGDSRILGIDDPRSSGLGNWRDETGLSFDEVRERLADAACAADADGDRIGTLLVHDANLGSAALDRGCVDLVVGGHTHVMDGPHKVTGDNGEIGWTFTVGTTGGAAYAIATGSKPRRPAALALITYRDGRPAGIQPITLQTNGRFDVDDYRPLTY